LQDGVYVLFSSGTYVAADNWTFTLLAANNQDSFLQYDSTLAAPVLRLSGADTVTLSVREATTGNTFDLTANASASNVDFDDGRLGYTVATGLLTYEGTNGAGGRTDYFAVVPGVAADRRVHFPVSLSHTEISTPATPGANIGKLYAKDGGGSVTDPYWLDATGVERNLATGQHPLNTGDPHTQYPLAASAETITGSWTIVNPLLQGSDAVTHLTISTTGIVVLGLTTGIALNVVSDLGTNPVRERTYQKRVLTTDATVTTLDTITIPATTTLTIEARVSARRTGGASGAAEDGATYIRIAAVKNVAGTATLIGTVDAPVTKEDQAGWDCTIDVTGATARIRVTGAASNNVSWFTTYRTYLADT
jgi:hypothetical protein